MIRLCSTAGAAPHPHMAKMEVWCFICHRCGHPWLPRLDATPRVCPKCKSPYWDRPRRAERSPEGSVS